MSASAYHKFTSAMLSGTQAWQDLVTDDVTLIGPLGRFEGREAFIQVNTAFFASICHHQTDRLVIEEDWVITQICVEVEIPTGQRVRLEVSEWYEFKEGKITYLRTYFDPREMV